MIKKAFEKWFNRIYRFVPTTAEQHQDQMEKAFYAGYRTARKHMGYGPSPKAESEFDMGDHADRP